MQPAVHQSNEPWPRGVRSHKGSFVHREFDEPNQKGTTILINHAFEIMRTEVTRAQWQTIVGTRHCKWAEGGDKLPATRLNVMEIAYFANKLSEVQGL